MKTKTIFLRPVKLEGDLRELEKQIKKGLKVLHAWNKFMEEVDGTECKNSRKKSRKNP